ncbi:unnamed protein product, partial [Amoebophrya sp. A25]
VESARHSQEEGVRNITGTKNSSAQEEQHFVEEVLPPGLKQAIRENRYQQGLSTTNPQQQG